MNTKEQKEKYLELLLRKNFNVAKTCRAIGISRGAYYLWLEKDEIFRKEVEYLAESDIDDSEETLRILRRGIPKLDDKGNFIEWLQRPDTTAVIFHLKTKGKSRGYVEKTEHETKVTGALNIDPFAKIKENNGISEKPENKKDS